MTELDVSNRGVILPGFLLILIDNQYAEQPVRSFFCLE
jgi:hypothetical protein